MADSLIDLAGKVIEPLTEPAKEALVPSAKASGSYLGLRFRDRTRDERKRMLMAEMDEHFELKAYQEKKEREYAMFVEKVRECRDEIPEEDRIEPRESLIGPAIDAAEHYTGEEKLRDMFAQRIASCCDRRKEGRNHPAFTAILQGLSPLDAQNLKQTYYEGLFDAVFLYRKMGEKHKVNLTYHAPAYQDILEKSDASSEKLGKFSLDPWQAASAVSLERAGLVAVYEKIDLEYFISFILERRMYGLTDLGSDFCSVCLPDPPKKED